MNENDYFTDRNYESNNRFNLDNFNNDDFDARNYTQNYFHNNNQNGINENYLYYPNNNLNKKNFLQMNSNVNQHNNDIVLFKKRINNLQNKLGKLNKFSSEINKAISYKFDNNNNDNFNENLNKTQNYYENYNNNYLNENNKILKINKSFDEFKLNFNNYDFVFAPGNAENYEEENDDNLNNNFEEQEDELQNIVNLNNQNNNSDLKYNEQFRDNSFIGFYDNVFASKNFELLNEESNNNMENNIPDNININQYNDNINDNKKYDYKNMQLYEQNYQFNIPKVTKINILDSEDKNKNKNNIQIVSNELSILTNENKKNLEKEKNLNDIKDKNLLKNEINNIIQNQNKENIENDKKIINLEEKRKKELQNYDMIIAKAKELNNQFNLEQKGHEIKEGLSNNDKENLSNKKEQNSEFKNIEKENIQSNYEKKNIIKIEKKDNNEDIKVRKIIKKDKNVSFIDDKIYIKYEQDDYILKTNVFNNKEKINFVTHDLKKYIHRLKKKEYLDPSIINCPNIDYNKINNDIINLMKKEKIVPNQNPRINNRMNKSVKNPTKMKIQINKNAELNNIKKIDKNGKKSNNKNNNIKIIKNTKNNKNEKNIKNITKDNLKKEKIMKKNKTDKLLKPKKDDKNEYKKNEIKNLDILNNPIFKEGQRAINNLKKFFEENNLDEENNEE